MLRFAVTALSVLFMTNPAQAMTLSFNWGPTGKCFDRNSPPMKLSGVPEGTAKLKFRMTDLNVPDYPHGGGTVDYAGKNSLEYGAFHYKGPCPPQPHIYQFTVTAVDAKGKELAKAKAKRKFP